MRVWNDAEPHDIYGLVAKGRPQERKKAADGGSCGGHEEKSERDLGRDENAPAMLCGSSHNASLPAGEHMRGIAPRETQRRDKTEKHATEP